MFEQTFPGEIYHSVQYKDCHTNKLQGRRVLIVGIGNSAGRRSRTGTALPASISCSYMQAARVHGGTTETVDVAMNVATVAKQTTLSTRSGAWYADSAPMLRRRLADAHDGSSYGS